MISIPDITKECTYYAVRSRGKGGQHVNKTATKVEVYFSISESTLLNDEQKAILHDALAHLINADGYIRLTCEEARSQAENKQLVNKKLLALIRKALTPKKSRIPTKKTKAANEVRLSEKHKRAERKTNRRDVTADE